MRNSLLKLYVKAQVLKQGLKDALKDEQGQDLVEYAAVIVLVVLALAGGMSTLASGHQYCDGGRWHQGQHDSSASNSFRRERNGSKIPLSSAFERSYQSNTRSEAKSRFFFCCDASLSKDKT